MRPLYTAFYTKGTLYEQEAERLRTSLNAQGLEHVIRSVPDRGSWIANTRHTAEHICEMLANYSDRPLVQLDADAVVWKYPWLFDDLWKDDADIAVHYRQGRELLNGTLWFNVSPAAREVAELYRTLIANSPGCANEQTMLAAAIEEMGDRLKVHRLPAGYCYIFDIMNGDLPDGEEPVIEHLQASRERSRCDAWERRRKRIEEIAAR